MGAKCYLERTYNTRAGGEKEVITTVVTTFSDVGLIIMTIAPSKPYKGFPLTWHKQGYWCKKIRGKVHYFGPRWGTWEQALEEYTRVRDDLFAGREPQGSVGLTIREGMNHFLTDRKTRLDQKRIVQRTFDDYKRVCGFVIKNFGANRAVTSLRPTDFTHLLGKIGGSPNTVGRTVTCVKVAFKYLWDADLIEKPVKFGPTFKCPPKKVMREYRAAQPPKLFKPDELRDIVDRAKPQMKAMILLGVNCGFGNNDCGLLTMAALDLKNGWHNFARPKTGIGRRCWLWPETVEALKVVLANRKEPKSKDDGQYVFITKRGFCWSKGTKSNPISAEFKKLNPPKGLTFYALRHTFETIGGESKDQVAVDHIMGHARDDMASLYRERISDDRLRDVAETIRSWFLGRTQ